MTQTASRIPSEDSTAGPTIRFEDVHTAWTQNSSPAADSRWAEALTGLTLTLPPGKITVLLGDRASGKDLLALHLLGETPPHSGRIMVNDTSLWELPEPERCALRNTFGFFRGGTSIRESKLDPDLTVRQSLTAHVKDPENLDETRLHTGLELLDLTAQVDTPTRDLDSGQRRRLALWLALADDPPVVVIDNPGEALDCRHFEAMISIICRWHSRVGATMLISVHSLRVATELADVVAVVRDGTIVAHGSSAEVLAGVTDDESFERKFQTGLGGVIECDPQRTLLGWQRMTRASRRVQITLVLVFFVLATLTLWLLSTGLITNPLLR